MDFQPSWSTDGAIILFMSQRDTAGEFYVMLPDGTGVQRITNMNKAANWPRYSPYGPRIVFCADFDIANHSDVYIMNSDGTNIKRVTNSTGAATAISPAWRPPAR